jgi:hypothetical protein
MSTPPSGKHPFRRPLSPKGALLSAQQNKIEIEGTGGGKHKRSSETFEEIVARANQQRFNKKPSVIGGPLS